MSDCPCRVLDSVKLSFKDCCAPFLSGQQKAPTAEALMRSRYTAYVEKNMDYIDQTQMNEKNEVFNKDEALKWADGSDWQGLEIKLTKKGGMNDSSGIVEFIAHYRDKASGTNLKHHETSGFQKVDGVWKFKEGSIHGAGPVRRVEPKLGRNDPCHCGSGQKYKKCHGA
jgi:SEC-C motif-containing protein